MARPFTLRSFAALLTLSGALVAGCASRLPAVLPPELPQASDRLQRWERVLALAPGTRIRIELRSGVVVRGRFGCADDEEKVVTLDGAALESVPRFAVAAVDMVTHRVGDFTWRGLAIGALFGATLAVASAGSSDPLPVVFAAPWFGGIGASAGAVLGLTPLESLVYEAPPTGTMAAPVWKQDQDRGHGKLQCAAP